jgi:hypothetical protein
LNALCLYQAPGGNSPVFLTSIILLLWTAASLLRFDPSTPSTHCHLRFHVWLLGRITTNPGEIYKALHYGRHEAGCKMSRRREIPVGII